METEPIREMDAMRQAKRSATKTSKVDDCEGPIDRVALLQIIHGPECNVEHLEFSSTCLWSDDPLPIQEPPRDLENFTGKRRGRGIVTGFYGKVPRSSNPSNLKRKGKNRNYWVIRCLCGGNQIMNHKTLRRQESEAQWMCDRCQQVRNVKRGFGGYYLDLKREQSNKPR